MSEPTSNSQPTLSQDGKFNIPTEPLPPPQGSNPESSIFERDADQRIAQRSHAHGLVLGLLLIAFGIWAAVIVAASFDADSAPYARIPELVSTGIMTLSLAGFLVGISSHVKEDKKRSNAEIPSEALKTVLEFLTEKLAESLKK